MKQITLQQDPNQAYTWNTEFSGHSLQRSQQRGIDRNLIYLAMDYSMTFFKQGLIFYAVVERLLPEDMDHHLRGKLSNLVVVISPESNEVVTCYKSENGVHKIKLVKCQFPKTS